MKPSRIPFIYIITLLYFVSSFLLVYLKWRAHTPSLDYHAYLQMYWNTANGETLMYNRSSESLYSLFSAHFSPFLLFIFPLYLLIPHPLILYFVFILIISLSIIPLYFYSLDKLRSRATAYVVSLSFLLYFPFLWTHRHGFAEEAFATPFLFLAFYFLYRKKFWLYLIFSFLTLSLRINMVVPVFLLGIYSIIKERSRWHGLFVCLLSIFWLYFTLNIIYPRFTSQGEPFYIYGFFGEYGKTLREILPNMFSNPAKMFETLVAKKKLILDLFGPVLFLSFLAPDILYIGIPLLIVNMLATYPRLSSSWTYYHASSIPFIWFGLVAALERLRKICERLKINGRLFINITALIILITNFTIDLNTPNGQHLPFSKNFNLKIYEINNRDKIADKIIYSIPKIYSVASQHSYLEHTAERKWQFPSTNFGGYTPAFLFLDMWADSSDFKNVSEEDPYVKVLEDSFFFLYARRDLVKKYGIKDFIENEYKNYDKDTEYLMAVEPSVGETWYSGTIPETPIEISNLYLLIQKLDIRKDAAKILGIPIERQNRKGPNDFLELFRITTGNLKIEILEGKDFKSEYKTVHLNTYKANKFSHKTDLIYVDLDGLNLDPAKTYWLKLSIDYKRMNKRQIFNKFNIYLTKRADKQSNLFYSLNSGETWSSELYPEKSLMYSLYYGLENKTIIHKGNQKSIKEKLEKLLDYPSVYRIVTIVGSRTEKR